MQAQYTQDLWAQYLYQKVQSSKYGVEYIVQTYYDRYNSKVLQRNIKTETNVFPSLKKTKTKCDIFFFFLSRM